MGRIRTIKPEFFTSLTLGRVSLAARLTFIGLWNYCDDDGRGRDEPRLIKAAVWPLEDKVTAETVDRHLTELLEARLIVRYVVDDDRYVAVRNWKEHQKIDRPRASKIPPPPARRADDAGALDEASTKARRNDDEPSLLERKGKERKGSDDARRRVRILEPDEEAVVEHYRAVHPKRLRGEVPEKVRRLLRAALRSYPPADLCRAIDGNAASQFHRDGGHLGLDLILRDASKIDYFLDLATKAEAQTVEMTDEMGEMRLHTKRDGWWGYERNGEWVRTAEVGKVLA